MPVCFYILSRDSIEGHKETVWAAAFSMPRMIYLIAPFEKVFLSERRLPLPKRPLPH